MDPRDRADAVLARAQARTGVVTPDNMTSPMDSANTQQIPRSVVNHLDTGSDPDTTTKLPSSMIKANDPARRDSHLTEAMPTTPMAQPGESSTAADVTQPVSVETVTGTVPTGGEDPAVPEDGGLVPTTTKQGESYVSRRLEGL